MPKSKKRSRKKPKPGCRNNQLRIAVIMITTPGNKHEYNLNSSHMNLIYANNYRYDFIIERCPQDTDIA